MGLSTNIISGAETLDTPLQMTTHRSRIEDGVRKPSPVRPLGLPERHAVPALVRAGGAQLREGALLLHRGRAAAPRRGELRAEALRLKLRVRRRLAAPRERGVLWVSEGVFDIRAI